MQVMRETGDVTKPYLLVFAVPGGIVLLQKELNSYISSKPKYPNPPHPLLCKSSPLSLVPVRTLGWTLLSPASKQWHTCF